jgi:hypothetical protein
MKGDEPRKNHRGGDRGCVLCGSRSKVATGMPMNVTFHGVKEGLNILKFTAA